MLELRSFSGATHNNVCICIPPGYIQAKYAGAKRVYTGIVESFPRLKIIWVNLPYVIMLSISWQACTVLFGFPDCRCSYPKGWQRKPWEMKTSTALVGGTEVLSWGDVQSFQEDKNHRDLSDIIRPVNKKWESSENYKKKDKNQRRSECVQVLKMTRPRAVSGWAIRIASA